MAIKFEKISPGMELLDVHSERAGNSTMRRLGVWRVVVVSVNITTRTALVSWNGNAIERWPARRMVKLFAKLTPRQTAKLEAQRRR